MPKKTTSKKKTGIPLSQLCRCADCGAETDYDKIDPNIPDLFERTEAGCEMPAGECTKCGALTYLVQNPYRKGTADLLRCVAAEIEAGGDDVPSSLRDMLDVILKAADDMYPEH